MNRCLQWLRHQREDERRKTEAEWENQILEEAASPSKPKASAEATIHEDVKIRILEVYRRCPILATKKHSRVEGGVHTEVRRIQKSLVQPIQVDDWPPTPILLWNYEDSQH